MSAIARSIELRADWCSWCAIGLHRECKGCPCPGAHRPCPACGSPAGSPHGMVHIRYGNGGGGNRPCPERAR